MFLLIAFFSLLGPVIAALATFLTALVLLKARPVLASVMLVLIVGLLTILLFEFRYDLGLELPDLPWMPSGAYSETITLIVACLLFALHSSSWLRWPEGLGRKWTTITAAVFWGFTALALLALSQLSYSI
ncbi:hypothetical protein BXY66_1872 [Shimia isoporae]|uniref:Uncharacterized protein n=1 Tax=Shimia isoporae TaxID=647720 RepID=A0A4R1NN01_9RHOB|nr:hypothetical protein [Shimia isoporae]TCL09807.1 hypothetical protein BXY66_1872 [Shimia isoporae]